MGFWKKFMNAGAGNGGSELKKEKGERIDKMKLQAKLGTFLTKFNNKQREFEEKRIADKLAAEKKAIRAIAAAKKRNHWKDCNRPAELIDYAEMFIEVVNSDEGGIGEVADENFPTGERGYYVVFEDCKIPKLCGSPSKMFIIPKHITVTIPFQGHNEFFGVGAIKIAGPSISPRRITNPILYKDVKKYIETILKPVLTGGVSIAELEDLEGAVSPPASNDLKGAVSTS